MKDSYHHGNLKHDLMETSIRIISRQGFEALSLRKVSTLCGVSHNAVYRHFENKQQLIAACRAYVTERVMEHLHAELAGTDLASVEALRRFCAAYISFYQQYPTYYSALYRNTEVKLFFPPEESSDNYPPLQLFQRICFANGSRKGWTPQETQRHMISLWSLVHGLTALVISPNVEWDRNWLCYLDNMIE